MIAKGRASTTIACRHLHETNTYASRNLPRDCSQRWARMSPFYPPKRWCAILSRAAPNVDFSSTARATRRASERSRTQEKGRATSDHGRRERALRNGIGQDFPETFFSLSDRSLRAAAASFVECCLHDFCELPHIVCWWITRRLRAHRLHQAVRSRPNRLPRLFANDSRASQSLE